VARTSGCGVIAGDAAGGGVEMGGGTGGADAVTVGAGWAGAGCAGVGFEPDGRMILELESSELTRCTYSVTSAITASSV